MTDVLVVPAAPALLTTVAPGPPMDVPEEWAALRRRVHDVLGHLDGVTTILSLVAGPRTAVLAGGVADLRAYGVPAPSTTHRGHDELARALHESLGTSTPKPTPTTGDPAPGLLSLDAAVQVRLAAEHGAGAVVSVEVGCDRRAEVAAALAAALPLDDVAVLVQGDLASSPIRRTDSDRGTEATAWDAAALPLLRAGDLDAWQRLDAGDVEPRGLGPLGVAMAWLGDRWRGEDLHWEAPRGIGAVSGRVASLS